MNRVAITMAGCIAISACGTAADFGASSSALSTYQATDYDDEIHLVELVAHQSVLDGDLLDARIDGVLYHVDALADRVEVSSNGAVIATALSTPSGVSLEKPGRPAVFSPNGGSFHFTDDAARAFGLPALMLVDHTLRDAMVLGELGAPTQSVARGRRSINISCCSGGLTISVTGKKGKTTSVTIKVKDKDQAETESDGNTGAPSGGDTTNGGDTSGGDDSGGDTSGGDSADPPPSGGS